MWKLGSFRRFGLARGENWVCFAFFCFLVFAFGSWPCGIGFVSHNGGTACRARTVVLGLGSFCIIGARHAVPVRELGSFRVFGGAAEAKSEI